MAPVTSAPVFTSPTSITIGDAPNIAPGPSIPLVPVLAPTQAPFVNVSPVGYSPQSAQPTFVSPANIANLTSDSVAGTKVDCLANLLLCILVWWSM